MARQGIPRVAGALLLPALLATLGGCGKAGDEHGRKSADAGRQSATKVEESAQSVTIETSGRTVEIMAGGVGWPAGIPAEVPPFSFGSIRSVTRSESGEGLSWSIAAGELQPDAIRRYAALLKERGFQASSMIVGRGGSVTGQRGNISIAVVSSDGTATISVALKR